MIKSYLYMVTILTTTSIFCETIHFTNSQNHLLNSTNHTVYRVNVPGSEPITIIEADQLNDNRESGTNVDESDRKYVTSEQLVLGGDFGNRRVGMPSDNKKTVYSPELLEKFLQDYSQKVQSEQIEYSTELEVNENSAEAIQEKLDAIAKLTHQMTTEPNLPVDEHFYNENETGNSEGGRDEDNIQEKYAGHYDDRNKKYQHYNNHDPHEVNRFNDRDGWVTLDAIPWSSSKVSKWNPNTNKVTHFAHVSPVHPQWSDEPDSYERPRPRPPSSYEPFPPHPYDDDYYKPMRPGSNPDYYQPGYDTLKPPAYGYNDNDFSKPIEWNKYDDRDGRPNMYDYHRPKPTQEYYQSSPRPTPRPQSTAYPSDPWYNNKHPSSYRPHWEDDVITDGHPSNFPQKPYEHRPPRPSSSSSLLYQEENKYVPNYQPTASQHHPQTHPSTGNGEWVLISTTKGYHFPPKHGKRAMGFQSANNSAEKTNTIRLTVLPAASTTSQKYIATNTIQNQTSIETMDDDDRLPIIVTPTPRAAVIKTKTKYQNRKKLLKGVPLKSRNSGDSTAVIAAVGAGMVPATVAMLMPMVLGRKKRNAELRDHRIMYTMHT